MTIDPPAAERMSNEGILSFYIFVINFAFRGMFVV